MSSHKCLSRPGRLESPHPSIPYSGRLMELLCSIILVLLSAVDRFWDQLPMGNTITPQFVDNDLPGLAAMAAQ